MIAFWRRYRYVEGTPGGGIIFPGRWGLNREVRIAGEPGIQIAEATTNEITNASFEAGVADWTATSMVTFAQSATRSIFGKYSAHCVTDAATDNIVSNTVAAADATETWTGSAYVYLERGDVKLKIQDNNAGWTDKANVTYSTTGGWYRLVVTATLTAGVTDGRLKISPATTAVSEYYVDGVQFEEKPFATPFCDSSLASDGAQGVGGHAAMARTAASLYWPTASFSPNAAAATISVHFRPWFSNSTALGATARLWDDGVRYLEWTSAGGGLFTFYDGNTALIPGGGLVTFSATALLHLVVTMSSSGVAIYVNGAAYASGGTFAGLGIPWGTNLYVGSSTTPNKQCDGMLAHLCIANTALSAAEVSEWYTNGPGPATGVVFYAPLVDSIHGELGECISLDVCTTRYALRYATWKPTTPVGTARGIESFERHGVDITAQKFNNVVETMPIRIGDSDGENVAKYTSRLAEMIIAASRSSMLRANGFETPETVDLIWRGQGRGRIGRSRILGWGSNTLTPDTFEDITIRKKGIVNLSFEREYGWRVARRPLGNGPTTVNTYVDGSHANSMAIASDPAWIEGELEAPAAVWLKNTNSQTYDRIVMALLQDWRGGESAPTAWLDAKDESLYINRTAGDVVETADATAASGTRVTINPAVKYTGLHFDGKDSYGTRAHNAAFNLDTGAGAFTMRGWIKVRQLPISTVGAMPIISKYFDDGAGNESGYILYLSPVIGAGFVGYTGSGSTTGSATTMTKTLTLDVWHHIAYVRERDASNIVTHRWYVDGAKTQEFICYDGSTIGTNTAALTFSKNATPNYSFFDLADWEIANVARYTGETYTVPTALLSADANTIALWHFNDGTGATAVDSGGSGFDLTLTNFSGTAATDWPPGNFSPLVTEGEMGEWNVPLAISEGFSGTVNVWLRCKVPSGGDVDNVTIRGRWETAGIYWTVDDRRPAAENQWEWVWLGALQIPWFAVAERYIEAGVMDTAGNRLFSVNTTMVSTADDLYLDAFLFLPANGFYADIDGANLTASQNYGLLIDNLNRKMFVTKTGTTMYSQIFEPGLAPRVSPLTLVPGKQAWLHLIVSRSDGSNVLADSIDVYPVVHQPMYLLLPADE